MKVQVELEVEEARALASTATMLLFAVGPEVAQVSHVPEGEVLPLESGVMKLEIALIGEGVLS